MNKAGWVLAFLGFTGVIALIAYYGGGEVLDAMALAGFWGLFWVSAFHVFPLIADVLAWAHVFRPTDRPRTFTLTWTRWVAESVRVELSEQTLSVLEHRWLGESTLPAHDRERLQAALASMCGPAGESRKLRLSFRQGEAFGPNAFALPDGNVVMLDELYRLLDNDEQRLAVLAHEAGHVHHDHGIRALVRNSLIATAMTLWLGDISSWLAAAPVVFVHARHSREQEREADAYAAEWLSRNGIEPAALAAALERMTEALAASASGDDGGGAHFLSTHPAPAERIRTLRAAGQASAGCAA